MRRWSVHAVKSTACTRPALRRTPWHFLYQPRFQAFSAGTYRPEQEKNPRDRRQPRKYTLFDRVAKPQDDIHAWLALLDGALPPHLRDWNNSDASPVLSAVDVAEILLSAQYPENEGVQAHDLLYCLGFELGRWNAVVWLIRSLVERFPAHYARHHTPSQVNAVWKGISSLDHFTEDAANAVLEATCLHSAQVEPRKLKELTGSLPKEERLLFSLGHDALGQVWRTLGEMTKACAGGEIRAEVLEIIAYLHHKEIMPLSIYRSEPHPDGSVIQQPPLLSILSSRILTSLSDAAWRAHEKLVVEEAKAKGAEYAASRPEVPGSVYRVNVAGLRPELWMELILWSCIQGGWTLSGTEILRAIVRDEHWKSLSWKEYEKTMPPAGQTSAPEWFQWEHAYKTRAVSRMDAPRRPVMNIARTVSAEVINAYIDALASHVDLGIGRKGVSIEDLTQILHELKAFLRGDHMLLDLSFGSWDALVTRLIESQTIVPERDTAELQRLVSLSAGFASGIYATNNRDQPVYVRDGNLAMQGLLHRALYGQIAAGSLEGALEVYKRIQARADADKRKSLRSFMTRKSMLKLVQNDMFTSNYSGIDYPAFSVKLPTTILGSFLELVTDAKEYEFGRWLLYNDEVDGPVIGEALYEDTFIQPAVISFAAASNDQKLLAKFKAQRLSRDSFRAVFNTQVDALHWDAAVRVLEHLAHTRGRKWSLQNLTKVAYTMLIKLPIATAGETGNMKHLDKARAVFRDMCSGKYNGERFRADQKQIAVQNVLSVLSAIDRPWADFCSRLHVIMGHHPFILKAKSFNAILEGVVVAYGSAAGRRLLETFWSPSARSAYDAALKVSRDMSGRISVPRTRPSVLQSIARQRISVTVPAVHGAGSELIMYGALTPNVNTILIVLRRALEELRERPGLDKSSTNSDSTIGADAQRKDQNDTPDTSARGIVRWAVRRLAELPYVEGSITEKLHETLSKHGMEDLRDELPAILRVVEGDLLTEAEEDTARRTSDDEQGEGSPALLPEPLYAK